MLCKPGFFPLSLFSLLVLPATLAICGVLSKTQSKLLKTWFLFLSRVFIAFLGVCCIWWLYDVIIALFHRGGRQINLCRIVIRISDRRLPRKHSRRATRKVIFLLSSKYSLNKNVFYEIALPHLVSEISPRLEDPEKENTLVGAKRIYFHCQCSEREFHLES